MQEIFAIRIRKEALKFASSHMTVFPNGTKEALHGHQYVPTVILNFTTKQMIPFENIKQAMKKISQQWDEKVLLAMDNPHFKVLDKSKKSIHFTLCNREYLLPFSEVELLPIENVTCEELAFLYAKLMGKNLPLLKSKQVYSWTVEIEESPGQSASYTQRNSA